LDRRFSIAVPDAFEMTGGVKVFGLPVIHALSCDPVFHTLSLRQSEAEIIGRSFRQPDVVTGCREVGACEAVDVGASLDLNDQPMTRSFPHDLQMIPCHIRTRQH